MTIFDILKAHGLPSNEIKQRFSNNQIKINGDVVKENIDLEVEDSFMEIDDFFSSHDVKTLSKILLLKCVCESVGDMFDTNLSGVAQYLKGFVCLTFSKKDHIILIKK
jgi:hypothetical protein